MIIARDCNATWRDTWSSLLPCCGFPHLLRGKELFSTGKKDPWHNGGGRENKTLLEAHPKTWKNSVVSIRNLLRDDFPLRFGAKFPVSSREVGIIPVTCDIALRSPWLPLLLWLSLPWDWIIIIPVLIWDSIWFGKALKLGIPRHAALVLSKLLWCPAWDRIKSCPC